MQLFKKYIERAGVSLPAGDVAAAHKGRWIVHNSSSPNLRSQELRRRISDGSFLVKLWRLPDVCGFRIKLNSYNPLLMVGGIVTRYGSNKELIKGPNRRINRYLSYMQHRMLKYKEKDQLNNYWRVGMVLVVFSHSYLSHHLWKIDKNIYRDKHLTVVKKLITRVNLLRGLLGPNASTKLMAKKLNQKLSLPPRSNALSLLRKNRLTADQVMCFLLEYRRMYLPKTYDPVTHEILVYRPLGIPTKAWRVFQSMQLGILTGHFSPSPSQHGFVPTRGTLTAWQVVNKEVIDSRNIYEIDFKGYFPSVNASLIMATLNKYGMPKPLTDYLVEMGITPPELSSILPVEGETAKLDETNALYKHELDMMGLLRLNPHERTEALAKMDKIIQSTDSRKTASHTQSVFLYHHILKIPSFCIDENGNYCGKVLAPLFEEIRIRGKDKVYQEISDALGYACDDIEGEFYYETLYEYVQYQSAIRESLNAVKDPIPGTEIF